MIYEWRGEMYGKYFRSRPIDASVSLLERNGRNKVLLCPRIDCVHQRQTFLKSFFTRVRAHVRATLTGLGESNDLQRRKVMNIAFILRDYNSYFQN